MKVEGWPSRCPRPWLVNVGGTGDTPIGWYVESVKQFLGQTCPDVKGQQRWLDRIRPLVALPIVGTGKGGGQQRAGDIVTALLPLLYETAEREGVDCGDRPGNGHSRSR